jgi:hypothetical protein
VSILVTFADGHSTLVVDRAAADQIVAYWPQLKATIRDLDQEARDREEMIGMLTDAYLSGGLIPNDERMRGIEAMLRRLGRLP